MSKILGISYHRHDSAAVLCIDGRIVAAAAEERFTRRKHCADFPKNAAQFCLAYAGVKPQELDCVSFYERPDASSKLACTSSAFSFSAIGRRFSRHLFSNYSSSSVRSVIQKQLAYKGKVIFVDHHYAHAASAFYASSFQRCAILIVDGAGGLATVSTGIGEGNAISLDAHVVFPHSLGLLYSGITAYLGFAAGDGEGTVMGLAGYGKPSFLKEFSRLVDLKTDGSFRLNPDYLAFYDDYHRANKKLSTLLGPARLPESDLTQRHFDIAATLQSVVEHALVKMANSLSVRYNTESLCLAGGVALNCTSNGLLLTQTPFKNIFVQPAAGDDGAAMGAALYADMNLFGEKRRYVLDNIYLGPEYSDQRVEDALQAANIRYRKLSYQEIPAVTARYIFEGKVVGWVQGRMEFGPRALGGRSILANPCNPRAKEVVNDKVKHREPLRPYAPSVCAEDAGAYFDITRQSPFMTFAVAVRPEKRTMIPGVTHADGTARVQTVTSAQNPVYYNLLREFEKLSGVPIVLNTSFNVRGEPMVCAPEDALACFLNTDMDVLVMGSFLIDRAGIKPLRA